MTAATQDNPPATKPLSTFGGTLAHMQGDGEAEPATRRKRVLMLTHRLRHAAQARADAHPSPALPA